MRNKGHSPRLPAETTKASCPQGFPQGPDGYAHLTLTSEGERDARSASWPTEWLSAAAKDRQRLFLALLCSRFRRQKVRGGPPPSMIPSPAPTWRKRSSSWDRSAKPTQKEYPAGLAPPRASTLPCSARSSSRRTAPSVLERLQAVDRPTAKPCWSWARPTPWTEQRTSTRPAPDRGDPRRVQTRP